MNTELMIFLLTAAMSAIGYFLRGKDAEQAAQIKTLFEKHDADVIALQELRVLLASKHYERTELDAKFDKLDTTFKEGFNKLGDKFDRLFSAMTDHISKENSK